MPTRTAPELMLVAHVPVDRFEICWGPTAARCAVLQERLHRGSDGPEPTLEPAEFTLKTAASDSSFRRRLKLATIFGVEGASFGFTAIFSGQVVSGLYDTKTRTGWFNLD